jgi:hypothetical protein
MKKYLLGICLAAITCCPMFGDLAKHKSSSSEDSEQPNLANASARDTTEFDLTFSFQDIPFSQNVEVYGTGIEQLSDTEFQLDAGVYLITYSGVTLFQASDLLTAFVDYAVNLGDSQVIEFQDSGDIVTESIKLRAFAVDVPVPWPSVLTIQAQIDPTSDPSSAIAISNRAIGIVKLI